MNLAMLLPQPFRGRALITGASGFVGGHLRDALIEAGADVVTLRRPSSRAPKPAERAQGRSVVAAYSDLEALTYILRDEKPDYVFHVAGSTKGVSYDDFREANVMPTEHLARATLAGHPALKRFVLVSSVAAFGPSRPDKPHREEDPRRPVEHYGRSKLEAEEVLERLGDRLPYTILRPGGVYGPADVDYFNLFAEIERGRNLFFGNRKRWFSAVYIDDCVRGIVEAALSEKARGRGYFLSDGAPVTWEGFQSAIVQASGRRVLALDIPELFVGVAAVGGELMTRLDKKPRLFNRQKAKMGAQAAWTCSHDRAEADFGYRPTVPLHEGVKQALDWYREQGWV